MASLVERWREVLLALAEKETGGDDEEFDKFMDLEELWCFGTWLAEMVGEELITDEMALAIHRSIKPVPLSEGCKQELRRAFQAWHRGQTAKPSLDEVAKQPSTVAGRTAGVPALAFRREPTELTDEEKGKLERAIERFRKELEPEGGDVDDE